MTAHNIRHTQLNSSSFFKHLSFPSVPPTFVQKIENVSTVLGDMAVFICSVEGSPPLSVQWLKDETWIPEDPNIERSFQNNEATFRIPACEATHGGKYTCQVVNEAGQDAHSPLSPGVVEPPTIQEKPEEVKVTRGDPVSLECRVAGSPQLSVRWMRRDKELHSYSQRLAFRPYQSSAHRLVVMYHNHVSVWVLVPPTFITEPESQAVPPNSAVLLRSVFEGTPPFTVKWFKHDVELINFSNGVATLKLTKTTQFDHGEYVCQAENRVGSASASCHVTVKGDARFQISFLYMNESCCDLSFKHTFFETNG
uniref:Ig-like domain-containing protein n=1 Tax=Acanthochromis polyacanthus TaxID=80966 RepID=A0A3Q1G1E3_9TELE